ncbi:MAG: membrane protein insertase YidC [Planctomycetota bacterium]
MPRLLLIVTLGLVLFMVMGKGCQSGPKLPPALGQRNLQPWDPATVVELRSGDTKLQLDADGRILSLVVNGKTLIQPAPLHNRPLAIVERRANGELVLLPGFAQDEAADEKSITYISKIRSQRLEKHIAIDDDGNGITVSLKAHGFEFDSGGFELTALGGVPMSQDEDGPVTGLVEWTKQRAQIYPFARLAKDQAEKRMVQERRLRNERKVEEPGPGRYQRIKRDLDMIGALGTGGLLKFEGITGVRAVNTLAYRAVRDGSPERDMESWISLDHEAGKLEASFRITWASYESFANEHAHLPAFRKGNSTEHVLENGTMRIVFSDRGAGIARAHLKKYALGADDELSPETWIPIVREEIPASERALTLKFRSISLAQFGGLDSVTSIWKVVEQSARHIRFRLEADNGWRVEKTVTLPGEDEYDLWVDIEARKPDGERDETFKFTLVGPSGIYMTDAYRGVFGADPPQGLLLERPGETENESIDDILEEPLVSDYSTEQRGRCEAVAIGGAYFLGALITEATFDANDQPRGVVTRAAITDVELRKPIPRVSEDEPLKSSLRGEVSCLLRFDQGRAETRFQLYLGPRRVENLDPLGIRRAIDFGFFSAIGRVLLWLMKFFAGIFNSYGVAIICMTLFIRALLFPVSYKTQLSMQRYSRRMQKIKPILERLQEQYKSNPQRLNQERMKVMREHKIGLPLGCLTLFLQIPIWIALFSSLRVEFSLRHQPFLWANDLAMPDALFQLPFWPGSFNALPLLMLGLWVWQQKATPTPASDDPQVQAQMKMLKFMPFMFFIFLYKYACALSVYMCISSAWGIVEGKMVRRAIKRLDDAPAAG